MKAAITLWLLFFSLGVSDSLSAQTPAQPPQQPEFARQGQQLIRDGKPEEALALFRKTLLTSPDSFPANIAAGSVLDLMGKGDEARKYFSKAMEVADTPEHKAGAQRAMAMSYAFEEIATRQSSTSNRSSTFMAARETFSSRERSPTRRLVSASTPAIWTLLRDGTRWGTTRV